MHAFWGFIVFILGLLIFGLGVVIIVENQEGPRISLTESTSWKYVTKVSALIIGGLLMAGWGISFVIPQDYSQVQQFLPGDLFR
jgi:hypothetical protein